MPARIKPFLLIFIFAGLLACAGCSRHYVVKLTNGSQFATRGKPKLQDDGGYHFTDVKGRERSISAGRVSSIQPASMSEQEEEAGRTKVPAPKGKHWYWPF